MIEFKKRKTPRPEAKLIQDKPINYADLLPAFVDPYEYEERAAIKEYCGNIGRQEAEKQAFSELKNLYRF